MSRPIRLLALLLVFSPIAFGLTFHRALAADITKSDLATQADLIDFGDLPSGLLVSVTGPDGAVTFTTRGENPDGSPVDAAESIRVGSVTKIFTAALVLSLVDDGKVDLDTSAAEYITRAPIPADITVRQLLSHTSGLPSYLDAETYYSDIAEQPDRVWTPEEILALIDGTPVAEPGSQFLYANTNFIYLGLLIEEVTGQPYDKVLTDRILEPLELTDTWLDGYQTGTAPAPAWAYLTDGYGEMTGPYTAIATSVWSAGALVSTAADLHRFMTALFAGDIISAESLTEMTTAPTGEYGLGLIPFGDASDIWGHIGSMPGYSTFLAYAPSTGRSLFISLTNDALDYYPALPVLLTLLDTP